MTSTTTSKRRGLGRGLMNMLSDASLQPSDFTQPAVQENLTTLPLQHLIPGKYQPRQSFPPETLHDLAESIRAQGILQPLIVRPLATNQYEIIAGERRWRAAQLADLTVVPVIIRRVADEIAMAIALIENIQRENLNVLEEAQALQRLQEEFALTQQQIAEAVGKSRVAVTHLLRLLTLPAEIKRYLQEGKLERGHAKVLAALPAAEQIRLAKRIVEQGLSVRAAEQLAQQRPLARKKPVAKVDSNITHLQRQLSDHLATPVSVQHSANGQGKLIIHYRNLDILQGVLARLGIE